METRRKFLTALAVAPVAVAVPVMAAKSDADRLTDILKEAKAILERSTGTRWHLLRNAKHGTVVLMDTA